MPVLCIESGITYATGVAAVAAEGGANRSMRVSGSVSFATSVNASQYNLGIVIFANPGEETQDDGDINIGAQMTGAFSCAAPNSLIANLRTNNLNLTSAPSMTIGRLITDGLGSDGILYNDTVTIDHVIVHNANDSVISSATRPNSNIKNVTSVDATRFGFANGKFNDCVDANSANQGYFGEMPGSGNLWEHDGSGTNTITESPVTDVFVDFAAGKYGILANSGPGAANAGGFIFTASGGVTANGDITLPSLVFAGSATDSTPEVTANGDITLPSLVFAGSATDSTPEVTANGDITLPSLVFAGSATDSTPEVTANGDITLPSLVFAGSATDSTPGVTANGDITLPSLVFSGSATDSTSEVTANGDITLPSLVFAGSGGDTPPLVIDHTITIDVSIKTIQTTRNEFTIRT